MTYVYVTFFNVLIQNCNTHKIHGHIISGQMWYCFSSFEMYCTNSKCLCMFH